VFSYNFKKKKSVKGFVGSTLKNSNDSSKVQSTVKHVTKYKSGKAIDTYILVTKSKLFVPKRKITSGHPNQEIHYIFRKKNS
jgi:hypothetical protein